MLDSNDNIVQASVAADDSVEHIFWQVESGGDYKIRVVNAGGGNEWPEGYGLAWWAGDGPGAPKPGDFNGDGAVDGADLQEWKDGFGGEYDGNDFLVWQRNYEGTAATAVPEPSSALMLSVLGLATLCVRRQTTPLNRVPC